MAKGKSKAAVEVVEIEEVVERGQMRRMDAEEFIELGKDTKWIAKVPKECNDCAYLRKPNLLHTEYYCNLVMCSNHKNVETPGCEHGKLLLRECKVTDSRVIDLVFAEDQ